jgi:hypothetical protein
MVKFDMTNKDLYLDGNKSLRGGESWKGSYWFTMDKAREQ